MVKYRHLFNKYNPFGGLTLVYTKEAIDDHGLYIDYRFSVCSEKDHYCRETGINTALTKQPTRFYLYHNTESAVEAILIDILKSYQLPKHAVYTVLRELDTIAYIKYEKICLRNRELVSKNKKGEFDE